VPIESRRPGRWPGPALLVLGAVLAANAILGPLALGVIEYRYSTTLTNQGIGLDAVALFAAAPLSLAAGVLTLRGRTAGLVLGLIPATFAAYMAPQYVVGPDYLGIPGNNEQFFLLHLAMFVLGVGLIAGIWTSIDPAALRPATRRSDRLRSLVLLGVVAFILLGRWLAGIVDLLGGPPFGSEFEENPTAYLLIGILDLGIVVPAAAAAAIALLRGTPRARIAAFTVIGWFALVPASVAAMAIAMEVNGDPNADSGITILFSVAAVVFTAGAAILFRPILARRRARLPGLRLPGRAGRTGYGRGGPL
jgi:hypothetical protein